LRPVPSRHVLGSRAIYEAAETKLVIRAIAGGGLLGLLLALLSRLPYFATERPPLLGPGLGEGVLVVAPARNESLAWHAGLPGHYAEYLPLGLLALALALLPAALIYLVTLRGPQEMGPLNA